MAENEAVRSYPDYFPDDEDITLFLKECMLAGKETSIFWNTNDVDMDGKKGTHRSIDDEPRWLDRTAWVGVWNERWQFDDEDPFDIVYRYREVDGKAGWWVTDDWRSRT